MIPPLGVVTPIYSTIKNSRLEYFKETAASILAQNHDFRWLIIDDGSTDKTPDYIRSLDDSRIQLMQRTRQCGDRKTSSAAMNCGLEKLHTDGAKFFCYIHSDDLLTEDSLQIRQNLMDKADLIYGKIATLAEDTALDRDFPLADVDTRSTEVMKTSFPHHTSMWSRKLLERLCAERGSDIFNVNINGAEDLDVTLGFRKVMEQSHLKPEFIDETLYLWRDHDQNITTSLEIKASLRECLDILKRNGIRDMEFENHANVILSQSRLMLHLQRPGYWLPEYLKRPLRGVKKIVRAVTGGIIYPGPEPKPPNKLDVDPYWFRTS